MTSVASRPLSDHDAKVLSKVECLARRLDHAFSICGVKLGWSSIVGFVPAVGDVLEFFMAWMVIYQSGKVEGGLDKSICRKMWFNVFLDFVIGFIPLIGDIADIFFRCNRRNAEVLKQMLEARCQEGLP